MSKIFICARIILCFVFIYAINADEEVTYLFANGLEDWKSDSTFVFEKELRTNLAS